MLFPRIFNLFHHYKRCGVLLLVYLLIYLLYFAILAGIIIFLDIFNILFSSSVAPLFLAPLCVFMEQQGGGMGDILYFMRLPNE